MFEMFITIVAAVAASVYGLSNSVFMNGPNRHFYRVVALAVIFILYLAIQFFKIMRKAHIRDLNVDVEDYLYYHKFTSFLYRCGYFLSYFVQNLMFDYTYMRRNFNFAKGLDVYDGGVGDYYIKFRNTWYSYLKLTLIRHRVSLKKLQAYAQRTKNEMILDALKKNDISQYEDYLLYRHEAEAYFSEHHFMNGALLKTFQNYKMIDKYYVKNLRIYYRDLLYIEKHEPKIKDIINRRQQRSHSDVNDFKKMKYL